jgi:succinate dehydrogenase hydrophobic anchor subunit
MSDLPDSPSSPRSSVRAWNVLFALSLLGLSAWTLAADLAHEGHFVLQTSISSLVLGLHITAWTIAALIFAAFPKRHVFTAVVLVTLRYSFGWPLLYWMGLRTACLTLDLLLVVLAGLYLLNSLLCVRLRARDWFRWQHSAAVGAFCVIVSILSFPAGWFGLVRVIEDTSSGFVRLTLSGLELAERVYEKDGRRVHLIGMVHIADSGFYESLNRSLAEPVEGRRLVLLEGVSDSEKRLPQSFASGKTYRDMAERLGLAEQALGFAVQSDQLESETAGETWGTLGVDFRPADIDVSELDPRHRDRLVSLLSAMEKIDLSSFLSLPDDMTARDLEELIVDGLVKRRNARLMEVFAAEEANYAEVFMPWGAAHLPDLERRLLALGYEPVKENRRLGIDLWKSLKMAVLDLRGAVRRPTGEGEPER